MEDYLEDVGAEVEINPDEVEYYDSSAVTPPAVKRMEDYLEDVGAEVEINPDEVEYYDSSAVTPPAVKRKKTTLRMRKRHYTKRTE